MALFRFLATTVGVALLYLLVAVVLFFAAFGFGTTGKQPLWMNILWSVWGFPLLTAAQRLPEAAQERLGNALLLGAGGGNALLWGVAVAALLHRRRKKQDGPDAK